MAIRFQAGLGRVVQDSSIYRKDTKMYEITLARVTKVNHMNGTCDVITMDGTVIAGSIDAKGGGGVRITQSYGGYDESTGAKWGQIKPLAIGTWIVIGFLDSQKTNPVMLATLPNSSYSFNSQTSLIENKAGWNRMEALKTLDVHPDMSYNKIDGEGNREITFANKSFFKTFNKTVDPDDTFTDSHMNFDFNDLSEIDETGYPIQSKFDESKTPNKMLFVHRTDFDDEKTTWTKFYLGMDGLFRLTRDNNNKTLSFMEYSKDGSFKVKRILDSSYDEDGKQYSQFVIDKNGEIVLSKVDNDKATHMGVSQDNIAYIESGDGSYIRLGDRIEIEATDGLYSETFQKFIESHHIVVSELEPQYPDQHLVWVDIGDMEGEGNENGNVSAEDFKFIMNRVNSQIEELMNKTGSKTEFTTGKEVGDIVNQTLINSTYTTVNDVQNIINNQGSNVDEFTIEDINIFWNDAKQQS